MTAADGAGMARRMARLRCLGVTIAVGRTVAVCNGAQDRLPRRWGRSDGKYRQARHARHSIRAWLNRSRGITTVLLDPHARQGPPDLLELLDDGVVIYHLARSMRGSLLASISEVFRT